MTFSNKALNAYETNCLKRKSLLPSHHVINTITARLHVAVFTQFLSFFLTGKTMTIEDPLEVGFYHPASGEFTAACALVCGRAVSEERRGGDATQNTLQSTTAKVLLMNIHYVMQTLFENALWAP